MNRMRWRKFLLWIASGILFFSCKEVQDALGIKVQLDVNVLSNGLTVLLLPDPTAPLVAYQTWYRVGSVDETPGLTGITHMFEHLMFMGTPKYGPKVLYQFLESKGAEVNAYTTRDYSVFYEAFAPEVLENVIDMESDRMSNLRLDQETLNAEKVVVFEERRLRMENSVDASMQEALWQLAYRRHPYHWPVMGYPADLMAISVPKLKEYYETYFQPSNAALVIVGNFNPSTTLSWIKKYYGKIPSRPKPKRLIPPEPEQGEERRLTIREGTGSERFFEGYHITSASDDDSYALDVLSNILFEGGSARMVRRLIDEKNLVAGITGSAFTPAYPGLFIISGTMREKISVSVAEQEMDRLIQEVQEQGVTEEEINIAVKQLTVQLMDGIRTPLGLGQLVGTVQSIFSDPRKFVEDLSKYKKVKSADVKRVALKYLNPNNRSLVILVKK